MHVDRVLEALLDRRVRVMRLIHTGGLEQKPTEVQRKILQEVVELQVMLTNLIEDFKGLLLKQSLSSK